MAFFLAVGLVSRAAEARYASLIMDVESGRIISSYDPDSRKFPASLTKMMTLYLLFDALDAKRVTLDSQLRVSALAASQPPTHLGLGAGSHISVRDAIPALIIRSANDVAVVVAENIGGSQPQFAELMQRKARELGMTRTTFVNASGLPNPGQKTTARDLAKLARGLIRNHAKYYHYFSEEGFDWKGDWIPTHNNAMLTYPGADGLKTGFINASGFNLALSARRNGHRLIGILMGEETAWSRDTQMARLLDAAFERVDDRRFMASAPRLDVGPDGDTTPVMVAEAKVPPVPVAAPAPEPAPMIVDTKPRERSIPGLIGAAYAAPEDDMGPEGPVLRMQPMLMPPPAERVRTESPAAIARARQAAEDAGEWAIQVGAFLNIESAKRAAHEASTLVAGSNQTHITPVKVGKGKTMYRAQLLGFSRNGADSACRRLSAKDRPCMVTPGDARTLASAR